MNIWSQKLLDWYNYRANLLKDNESGISVSQLAKREKKAERTIATLLMKAKRDRNV